ncbi:hypothetical protein FQR65_LT12324 [Abscondita terminalis]|nr:hypothetical protein FQR65_LT12324 [Abscondita terminalis]
MVDRFGVRDIPSSIDIPLRDERALATVVHERTNGLRKLSSVSTRETFIGLLSQRQRHQQGKTNLSYDSLNPAHVPYSKGVADIEGSKSDVAINTWPPQASYPCGNFSDTSCLKLLKAIRIDKHLSFCFTQDVPPYSNSPPGGVLESDRDRLTERFYDDTRRDERANEQSR